MTPTHTSIYNVTDYGARPATTECCTQQLQAAIDACAKDGGGTVYFPAGTWYTGTLVLKSHITLYLEHGAVLKGSCELRDYPEYYPAFRANTDRQTCRSVLYAEKQHDICIEGHGVFEGNGGHANYQTGINNDIRRPFGIRFVECRNIVVRDITMRSSAQWMQHYLACDNVRVHGITVFNHQNKNADGIDIDGCRNVTISDCVIDSDDDAICLKSNGPRSTEHVTVSNCIAASHCNGIKLGTETSGGFRNIAISNCIIRQSESTTPKINGSVTTTSGLALMIVDGGCLENVSVDNCIMEGIQTPLFIRLGNRGRGYAPDAPVPGIGMVRDINIRGLSVRGAGAVSSCILGLPSAAVERVSLSDVTVHTCGGGSAAEMEKEVPEKEDRYPDADRFDTAFPSFGFYVRHARNISFNRIRLVPDLPDARSGIWCDDCHNLLCSEIELEDPTHESPVVWCHNVRNAHIGSVNKLFSTVEPLRITGPESNEVRDASRGSHT